MIMKLKEVEKKDNPMLDSTSLKFNISFDGATPSRTDIAKEIAKAAQAKPEQVSIEKIYSVFGQTSGYVTATVYHKDEAKKLVAQDHLAARITKAEKAQAAEKAKDVDAKKAEKEVAKPAEKKA